MAIAFAQSPVFNQQTTASTTIASGALSSAPTARNALLLVCYSVGNVTMTTPTGWQLLYSKSSTAGSMYVFTKEAQSGDSTSFSLTQSAANAYETALYELSGAASFILYNDATANPITTAATGWSTPSRTPLYTGVLPLAILCSPSTTSPGWSAASGWTQDYNNTSGISMFAAHGNLTPDYSTPVSMTDIISTGTTGISAIVMIAPAPMGAHVKQYSNTKTNTGTHTSSGALPIPALVGRMLVAFLTVATSGNNPSFTPPTGWLAGPSISDSNNGIFTYYHKVATGDPTTYQWTVNTGGTSVGVDVALFELEGADSGNPFQANVGTVQPGANATGFSLTVTPVAPNFGWMCMTDSHSDGLNVPSGWTSNGFSGGSVAGSAVTEYFYQQLMHGAAWTTTSQSQSWTLTGSTDPQAMLVLFQPVTSSGSASLSVAPSGHQSLTKATIDTTLTVSATGKQTKVLATANVALTVADKGAQTVANSGKKSLTLSPSGVQTAQRIGSATLSLTMRGTQDPTNHGNVAVFPTSSDAHVVANGKTVTLSLTRVGKQQPANQGHVTLSLNNNAGFQTKPSQGSKVLSLAGGGHQVDATGAKASAFAAAAGKQTIAKAIDNIAVAVTRKGVQSVANGRNATLITTGSGARVMSAVSSGDASVFVIPAGSQNINWKSTVVLVAGANGVQTFTEVGTAAAVPHMAASQSVANHGGAALSISCGASTQLHVQRAGSVVVSTTTNAVQSSMNGAHATLLAAAGASQSVTQLARVRITPNATGRQAGMESRGVSLTATANGHSLPLSTRDVVLPVGTASLQRYRKVSNGSAQLVVSGAGTSQVPTRGDVVLALSAAGVIKPLLHGGKVLAVSGSGTQQSSIAIGARLTSLRAFGSQAISSARDTTLVITMQEILSTHVQRNGGGAVAPSSAGKQQLQQKADVGLVLSEGAAQSHTALGYTFVYPVEHGAQVASSSGSTAIAVRGNAKVVANGVVLSLKSVVVRIVSGTSQVQ